MNSKTTHTQTISIRDANAEDAELILQFITELAIYEKAEHEVIASADDIRNNLFSENTTTQAVICMYQDKPIGFALYFLNFSTWLGKNGLYLEDLYISPQYRGLGAGKQLLQFLAKQAVQRNCGRFEWNVLTWNEPAIKFYQSAGAVAQDEWVGYRLQGQALLEFAES